MTLLNDIHFKTKKMHQDTENKPFLRRYQSPDRLTITDHYHHLIQLFPIYEALETKIKEADDQLNLASQFSCLLNRSQHIKTDIDFLKTLPQNKKARTELLRSTVAYVNCINQLDPKNDINAILANFLVRILGDLHGGQKLKNYVSAMYAKNNIAGDVGVTFYSFDANTLPEFNQQWLRKSHDFINTDELIQHANLAFKAHLPIFDELEKSRIQRTGLQCHSRLFSTGCAIATVAIGAAVTAIGLGLEI